MAYQDISLSKVVSILEECQCRFDIADMIRMSCIAIVFWRCGVLVLRKLRARAESVVDRRKARDRKIGVGFEDGLGGLERFRYDSGIAPSTTMDVAVTNS